MERVKAVAESIAPAIMEIRLHTFWMPSSVVVTEVSNGLEVRGKPAIEPIQLDGALGFVFRAPDRLDAVQVAVDVDVEASEAPPGDTQADRYVMMSWRTRS